MDAADSSLVAVLCANDVLPRFSYRARFGADYDADSYAAGVEAAYLNMLAVPFRSVTRGVLAQLLAARMLVYGLRGHCFLVCEGRGLIMYPHDDTGFGIIAFGPAPDKEGALDFLADAGRLVGFQSVIAR